MIKYHDKVLLNSTVAFCEECNKPEIARIMGNADGVFLVRICEKSGERIEKIADDYNWYLDRISEPYNCSSNFNAKSVKNGCPFDCGICEEHSAKLMLPVFSITNDCNLNCNICFTHNRADKKYFKSILETELIFKTIINSNPDVKIVNLTGGEPTLHPDFFKIIEVCKNSGIQRITVNTNGIRIAEDFNFAKQIKETDIQMVLSLDTLDSEKSKLIHGSDIVAKKLKALKTLEELDIPITLLCVCIKNINEDEIAEFIKTYLCKPFVKSFTIQNMTYTGANGSLFYPREHITIDEVENLFVQKCGFSKTDFFSLGAYHPLCYSAAYFIIAGDKKIPLTKIICREELTLATSKSYVLEFNSKVSKLFRDGIDKLWSDGNTEEYQILKDFFNEVFPRGKNISEKERARIIENKVKMIYIHPHMDADNFDLDRLQRCGDLVPDEKGSLIPACSYNLIYRKKDERFWVEK